MPLFSLVLSQWSGRGRSLQPFLFIHFLSATFTHITSSSKHSSVLSLYLTDCQLLFSFIDPSYKATNLYNHLLNILLNFAMSTALHPILSIPLALTCILHILYN